uniref:Uncharacterized protein n=1 Tax=Hyaloperonospora arabidopsidis (strain Emoy2) TaxID=559515 RepID=M4C030_HYAAE
MEIFTNLSGEIFSKLHRKVSRYVLVLLKKQYLLALNRSNLRSCTEYYARIHGTLARMSSTDTSTQNNPLKLALLRRNGSCTLKMVQITSIPMFFGILPPFRIQKAAARKRSHQKSTKRQPKGFERTERQIRGIIAAVTDLVPRCN